MKSNSVAPRDSSMNAKNTALPPSNLIAIGIVARALVNLKFPRMTQIARVVRAESAEVAVH